MRGLQRTIVGVGALAMALFHVPFEVSDNLGDLLQVSDASVVGIFLSNFTQPGFMRPAAWATSRWALRGTAARG